MSDSTANPNTLDPETGFTKSPSVGEAAHDLRVAATAQARQLVGVASDKASALKGTAVEKASQFKAAASEKASHFKEVATERWQDTRAKAKDMHITAEDYIRENPTKCVLGALGVGVLIGLIIRR